MNPFQPESHLNCLPDDDWLRENTPFGLLFGTLPATWEIEYLNDDGVFTHSGAGLVLVVHGPIGHDPDRCATFSVQMTYAQALETARRLINQLPDKLRQEIIELHEINEAIAALEQQFQEGNEK